MIVVASSSSETRSKSGSPLSSPRSPSAPHPMLYSGGTSNATPTPARLIRARAMKARFAKRARLSTTSRIIRRRSRSASSRSRLPGLPGSCSSSCSSSPSASSASSATSASSASSSASLSARSRASALTAALPSRGTAFPTAPSAVPRIQAMFIMRKTPLRDRSRAARCDEAFMASASAVSLRKAVGDPGPTSCVRDALTSSMPSTLTSCPSSSCLSKT
mmetsp:Transcript_5258/g.11779  ORF Transcript_5258/g.11779 Transcript_5258/m.11779 type:complete len:219 (+) Transcript_5258:260-916(+)